MRLRKIKYEILVGLMLLFISVASIGWVFDMVRTAPDTGTTDSGNVKQWSLVLILLSITTLFMGSVAGYLLGKYLHIT